MRIRCKLGLHDWRYVKGFNFFEVKYCANCLKVQIKKICSPDGSVFDSTHYMLDKSKLHQLGREIDELKEARGV